VTFDLNTLLALVAHAMQHPETIDLGSDAAKLAVTAARLGWLLSVFAFLIIWRSFEREMITNIQQTGSVEWGFWQLGRLYLLIAFSALMLEGPALLAVGGDPAGLIAQSAISWLNTQDLASFGPLPSASHEIELIVAEMLAAKARGNLLSAWLCLVPAVLIVAALARRGRSGKGVIDSGWIGVAIFLGITSFSDAIDPQSWAALRGDIEPLLRAELRM
jgi:hypothetical protein